MEANVVASSPTFVDYSFLPALSFVVLTLLLAGSMTGLVVMQWERIAAWYRNRDREKDSAKTVLLQITVPKDNEIKPDAMEQLIGALYAIKRNVGKLKLKRQAQMTFEIVAIHESLRFYVAVHQSLQDLVEKQINGAYPDAEIKTVPEYNIFSETGHSAYAQLELKSGSYLPIKTYKELPTDPLSTLTSSLAKMQQGEGAVVQIILSPADGHWKDKGTKWLKKEKDPGKPDAPKPPPDAKKIEAVEGKLGKNGFETTIRIVVSSVNKDSAKTHLANIRSAFEQFAGPYNNFTGAKVHHEHGFIYDFIHRFPPKYHHVPVLTPDEIASIFHLPNKTIVTPYIIWLMSRKSPAPDLIPSEGLYLGKSIFRGTERQIYLSDEDRRRHMYVIGRTGTGKTEFLKSLMLQDILAGKGICFIDPHGDAAEDMLNLIPPERAEDVIYFDPGDTERPFGMNMLEAYSEEQKHFIVAEILGLMYKLYDPNKTGIIGPRFEHGVRNAMLTAMAKPGNTFVEVMRIMTDQKFLQELLPLVDDPVVRRYWTDQIAQTADFHKSEVLDYTVSKFGKFVTNRMMRNIIGQSQSSFDLRKVMDEGKILIVNLSKGKMGEENSNFLGLILVPKILAAAMSRSNIPMEQRKDFFLYVDEFQNFASDTFASILSEARKYRLNLIVANQFIGQIQEDVKNAIFGNVGTLISFRVGVTDANFLAHEFAPVFSEADLVNVEIFHSYIKTQVFGTPVPPFSLDTSKDFKAWNAMKRADVGKAIAELSRLTYGKDAQEVEADITKRANL